MTVKELQNILAGLPEDADEWPVMIAGGPNLPQARVVIIVPKSPDDPASPRIELRDALVYRSPYREPAHDCPECNEPDPGKWRSCTTEWCPMGIRKLLK